ncbi:DUF3667 domain-containing protein [Altibacter sp.]|uniref:DUF3667 domain-containing protein n=1 Tax=Altibacter sp. TaxID=2024823 RepID=UPI00258D39D0|nr:DUF3667 domain-containing protein [Altibacter sp.]MCW8981095.1 DUF3667 domain-containing protein [Altibacter sp.]MCW9037439.1 DUF3667 domain-containing protein [Altibacter sp.]
MNCKNCEHQLQEQDSFCSNCGAKVVHHRLSLKYLWHEITEKYFNVDNTLLRTFLKLFTHPEIVIGEYIKGVRKKYVNVVSYYAIALTFAGLQIFILRKFFPEALDISFLIPENTPQANMDMEWTYDYYSILALINIPIYALMARLTFIGLDKYNFTEHLVIMAYLFAQFTLTTFPIILTIIILGGNFYVVSYAMLPFLFFYTALAYKRLYALTFRNILWRSMFFVVVAGILMLLIGLLQLVVMIFTGDFQEMVEFEKAKRGISYSISSAMNWTS